MKIFAKTILNREQLEARRRLGVDGIEIMLNKARLESPNFPELLRFASDSFPVVSLEAGDRLREQKPTDLTDGESRKYIERIMQALSTISNLGLLTVHLVGNAYLAAPPYENVPRKSPEQAEEIVQRCLEYVWKIDPQNKVIALENTFPTDWMDEDKGSISFYPIGKLSQDFGGRQRTYDIAHAGITFFTFRNLRQGSRGSFYTHEKFGDIPVHFSNQEMAAIATKRNLTEDVIADMRTARIVNVHFNSNRGLLDGYSPFEQGDLDLGRILGEIRRTFPNANLVAEVKERETGNYLEAPNQSRTLEYLKTD